MNRFKNCSRVRLKDFRMDWLLHDGKGKKRRMNSRRVKEKTNSDTVTLTEKERSKGFNKYQEA